MIAQAKRLTKSKFARNVAIVASGTAVAQAITMAFSPIITRLYGPEAFGILSTFTASLVVLMPLVALSYPTAIVLPKRDVEAVGIANISIRIAMIFSLTAFISLFLLNNFSAGFLASQPLGNYVFFIPLAMFLSGCMAVIAQWVIRKKLFNIKAKSAIQQAVWLNFAKSGVGLFYPSSGALIFFAAIANGVHAGILYIHLKKNEAGERLSIKKDNGAKSIKIMAKYRDFPIYRTPQSILYSLSASIPVFMIASLYGPAVVGQYAIAKLTLGAPATLIGDSIYSVFYPRFNQSFSTPNENSYFVLVKATLALAAISVTPFLVIALISPWVYPMIFGKDWVEAGLFAQWLALLSFFNIVARPSVGAIPVISMQRFYLMHEAISMTISASSFLIGYLICDSPVVAVALFCISKSIVDIFLVAIVSVRVKSLRLA